MSPESKMEFQRQYSNALSAPTTPDRRIEKVDRAQTDPELLKAAQGIESMYLDYLMNVMRKTIPESEYDFDNGATKIYQGMLDSEYAQTAARTGGVGLTDLIIASIEQKNYNGSQGKQMTSSPSKRTGGTNEGQPK